nr:hypothetical protein Iba_chr02bCG24860 [Ipomoea batatas]
MKRQRIVDNTTTGGVYATREAEAPQVVSVVGLALSLSLGGTESESYFLLFLLDLSL